MLLLALLLAAAPEQLYKSECARCHGENAAGGEGAPALRGPAFAQKYTLASLALRTRQTMPPEAPGRLSDADATTLAAHLLNIKIAPVHHSNQQADWPFYGGNAATQKYSPLDQINKTNVAKLQVAWRWKAQNFGKQPDINWQATPLMVNGVLYVTAGTRRDAVAIDAQTGETLWLYRLDEGDRGSNVARQQNRGLAYWSDGKQSRILLISPGFQLIALDPKTGRPIESFGNKGIIDLTQGLDRATVKPGQIGSSSPAIVIRDTIVVGAALQAGTAPISKTNVPGHIRGFDVRTGRKLWTFRTIPHPGEPGNETWEQGSWEYTGNAGAWAPLTGDEKLGYVYIPVEAATGDF